MLCCVAGKLCGPVVRFASLASWCMKWLVSSAADPIRGSTWAADRGPHIHRMDWSRRWARNGCCFVVVWLATSWHSFTVELCKMCSLESCWHPYCKLFINQPLLSWMLMPDNPGGKTKSFSPIEIWNRTGYLNAGITKCQDTYCNTENCTSARLYLLLHKVTCGLHVSTNK